MSEVKRYCVCGEHYEIYVDDGGDYVSYDDCAELKAQRDALAAEMSVMDAIHDKCVFITDDDYDACPKSVQEIIRSLAVMQIPATDAYLNSVRAEGVEVLTGKLQQLIDEGVFDAKEIGVAAGAVYEGAQIAAHLRAGKGGE